jgi:hypothetical protein
MTNKKYFYQLIDQKHRPVFGNLYFYEQQNQIMELVLIAHTKPYFYFIKFMDLEKESTEVLSYFKGNLQAENNVDFD